MQELPDDLQRDISQRLSDQALCRLRVSCLFFTGDNPFNHEWLRRRYLAQIRQYNAIPEPLIQRCLIQQQHATLAVFASLLHRVHRQLVNVLHNLPQAEWMVYAMLNEPFNVARAFATAGPHSVYQPYHFYALAGHWNAFVKALDECPDESWNQPSQEQVAKWAMWGGHKGFVENLTRLCGYADPRKDQYYCEILLYVAIASGDSEQVQILVPQLLAIKYPLPVALPELDADFAVHAAENGQFEIYTWLTTATSHHCRLSSQEHALGVLMGAARHDNLPLVQHLLGNKGPNEDWNIHINSEHEDKDICMLALYGGAVNVLRYIWQVRPDLLQRGFERQATAMHVAAYAGHSKVCVLLETEFKMDPKCIDAEGATIAHYAAKGGRGSCYLALVEAYFKGTPLLPDAHGQTPLDYAKTAGEYWFIEQIQNLPSEVINHKL